MAGKMQQREEYGLDAPGVLRRLVLIGLALGLAGLAALDRLPLLGLSLLPAGLVCLAMAGWMLASSLWLKRRLVQTLLNQRIWRGDETILDIGSGRGLAAVNAARRAPAGHVHALDLWQSADLSGNGPEGLRRNAEIAGVAGRLTIDTGDARALPYGDQRFGVVLSMTALHNIDTAEGRAQAIVELWRVTRPGGQILLFDIRYAPAYRRQLSALGARDVMLSRPVFLWGIAGHRLSAFKPAED